MKPPSVLTASLAACLYSVLSAGASEVPREDLDFFENKIRPVLVQECYECHSDSAKKSKGGLKLDTREGLLRGGESGAALVPGKSDASLLIAALKHENLEMPPKSRLPAEVVADFVRWIDRGAPDPRGANAESPAAKTAVDIEAGRRHWAFQPPRKIAPPEIRDRSHAKNAVDWFVIEKLEQNELRPVAQASRRELIRRASFDLTGLPPTPEEVAAFESDSTPGAFEKVVERLLSSAHYGERWARHWLDVARYAEDQAHTFGVKPNSNGFRYRDWVVNALNSDMPYDEFVRRQIAVDQYEGIVAQEKNQIAALGFFGLGAVYYKNSDAAKAAADELDDRIDTLTRGFLGLTVSCARCHDHKFDPIPTSDYYSLAGVFQSSKLHNAPLAPDEQVKAYDLAQQHIKDLESSQKKLLSLVQSRIAESRIAQTTEYIRAAWKILKAGSIQNAATISETARDAGLNTELLKRWATALTRDNRRKMSSLPEWSALCTALEQLETRSERPVDSANTASPTRPDSTKEIPPELAAASAAVQKALENALEKKGAQAATRGKRKEASDTFLPRYQSPLIQGNQREADIDLDITGARELYLVVTDAGDGITSDHGLWCEPRLIGPSGETRLTDLKWKGTRTGYSAVKTNTSFNGAPLKILNKTYSYGLGTHAYSEVAYDIPEGFTRFKAKIGLAGNAPGSVQFRVYFGEPSDLKRPEEKSDNTASSESKQAEALLKPFMGENLLKPPEKETDDLASVEEKEELSKLKSDIEKARKAAPEMYPVAHVITDATPANMHVFIRGNPARKGEEAPRRFLRVLCEGEPRQFVNGSGRRELADAIASPHNPLTARVMVNRIWQHHFGRGLVGTPSNFGTLGDKPTHPELLDYLATTFVESGWSIKSMHRLIMNSATYQRSSLSDARNEKSDADNRFLWRMNRSRLDVESWRDGLLSVSGLLDTQIGGPSVDLSDSRNSRRTVYSKISRHALDSLLRLFDFPDANITSDKRTETTVPQQQLFVLNSPFMLQQARAFAARIQANKDLSDTESRIHYAYRLALGRNALAEELKLISQFVNAEDPGEERPANTLSRWERVAQNILASNEFMYID